MSQTDESGAPVDYREIERVGELSVSEFKDVVRSGRPVVLRRAMREEAEGAWTLGRVRAHLGSGAVTALRTSGGRLICDGNPFAQVSADDFFDALERGERPEWHLSMSIAELPEAMRAQIPMPVYCAGARFLRGRLWIGRAGTVTPLHFDFPSNFLTQLFGHRRVLLHAPSQAPLLRPHAPWARTPNFCDHDPERARSRRGLRSRATPLGTVLGPGDVLYFPPLWWHHVRSLDTNLMVNYWCGGLKIKYLTSAVGVFKSFRGIYRGEWARNGSSLVTDSGAASRTRSGTS